MYPRPFRIIQCTKSCFLQMVRLTGFPVWRERHRRRGSSEQGCQMVSFQAENPNLGKFWRALDEKMLIYFMAIWNILQTFGIFCDHLVHFVFIWYIFSCLGNICQVKSGNPASEGFIFIRRRYEGGLQSKPTLYRGHTTTLDGNSHGNTQYLSLLISCM
jgi:hypothetical protein